MESALNSTIVLLGQYVCSISHNVYETIIEFSARLPQEREVGNAQQRPCWDDQLWSAELLEGAFLSSFSTWQTLHESGLRNAGGSIPPDSCNFSGSSVPSSILTSVSSGTPALERGWFNLSSSRRGEHFGSYVK
jgi:hypothetical protein